MNGLRESTLHVLSASKLKTFESCARKYYYQYIERLLTERHPAAALGSAVHKTIEVVYDQRVDPVITFLNEFDRELAKNNLVLDLDNQAQRRYKNDGVKMVGDYDYSARVPIEKELEFLLPFPNAAHPMCMIHGYIDQAYEWGFVDLKTNGRKPKQDILNNDLQFIIYDWAFNEIYNRPAEHMIWHHLRTHEDLAADVSGKLDIAVRIIDSILEKDFTNVYEQNIGEACRFCPFKVPCLGVA